MQGWKLVVGKFHRHNGKKGIRKKGKNQRLMLKNQKKTNPTKTAARKMMDEVGLLEVN